MKINDFEFAARENATILEASREAYGAKQWDIYIPTLQYLTGIQEEDHSGVCVVTVKGIDGLVNASTTKVAEGIDVYTRTPEAMGAKIAAYKQIMATHDQDCKHCFRTGNCELQNLALHLWLPSEPASDKNKIHPIDKSPIIVRDDNKCIRCGRCVSVCKNIQGIAAIEQKDNKIVPANDSASLNDTKCVNCGQCITACPVGALRERDDSNEVLSALADPEKFVIIQTAPSLRAGIGEAFEYPVGSETEGKLVAALRELGFDRVYDTTFSADLTVMEEATEFLNRLQNDLVLPMATSCCPAWVRFCEQEFPEFLPNISSCKSPQQMFGAIAKSYLAEKTGIAKEQIIVVSAMPCTAKKAEIIRKHQNDTDISDVDYVLTSREIAAMIKKSNIKFASLSNESYDSIMGCGSSAGVLFGVTGGVMEAALRTAADWISVESLSNIEYHEVRGLNGIKEATVKLHGHEIKIAVVHGLANAKLLLKKIKAGDASYQFIEVMACPGGCVNGGGQPQQCADTHISCDIRKERGTVLYQLDEESKLRKAHENPEIQRIYEEYLGMPGSKKAHQLLHTIHNA